MPLPPAIAAQPVAVKATALMMVAMACFACMGMFIRLAAQEVHPLEIVFFRNFLAVLLMAPWLCRHGFGALRTTRFGLYSVRALLNLIGMAAGFTALTLIPLAEATALSFTLPLFATLGAALLLGERLRIRRLTAIAIGFTGTLIVLRPGFETISGGALLALTNALFIAVTTLIVKVLTRTERPEAIVTYMVLLQTPLALLPALYVWQTPGLLTLLWLLLLAGAGTLGHLCFTRACALVEVSQLQPMTFVQLPLVALLAYLLFAEVPTAWTWLGGAVIFAATAYITRREAQLARRAREAARSA